jgi:hypothetical protein
MVTCERLDHATEVVDLGLVRAVARVLVRLKRPKLVRQPPEESQ